MIEIFGTRVGEIVHWDCNNIEVFVKRTVQQHCQMLIIGNSWIYDYGNSTVTNCSQACVHLQLREATIHKPTTQSECLCKSFVLFVGLFPLAIAFELLLLDASSGSGTSFHTFAFSFLALVDKTTHLPEFLVASIVFGFCIISYAEFQSCLLTPFISVLQILKPHIALYTFIFNRPYWSRTLSSILCTLATTMMTMMYIPKMFNIVKNPHEKVLCA